MNVFAKFGPGKYFIGDICYALPDEKYDKVWGDKYNYAEGFYDTEGFAVAGTAIGDGLYTGSDNVKYSVDAGVIGITNITEEQRYTDTELAKLGRVVYVKEEISMTADNGYFDIDIDGETQIEIHTSWDEEEEDDE